MFVADKLNNTSRLCNLPGDAASRLWRVVRAVAGDRYLVCHRDSGEYRTVPLDSMYNLY